MNKHIANISISQTTCILVDGKIQDGDNISQVIGSINDGHKIIRLESDQFKTTEKSAYDLALAQMIDYIHKALLNRHDT